MEHQRSGIFIIVAFQTDCSVARLFRIINNGIQAIEQRIYLYGLSGRTRNKKSSYYFTP